MPIPTLHDEEAHPGLARGGPPGTFASATSDACCTEAQAGSRGARQNTAAESLLAASPTVMTDTISPITPKVKPMGVAP